MAIMIVGGQTERHGHGSAINSVLLASSRNDDKKKIANGKSLHFLRWETNNGKKGIWDLGTCKM